MNLKLIDPNKINPGGLQAQIEDLCIDLQLTAIKKGKTLLLGDGKAFDTDQVKEQSVDLLSGQNINGSNYLTTLFTEIGSGYDVINSDGSYKNFETLGITSLDIEFNASNVPVIKMTLTDIRGRMFQQGNNSPYSVFFEFPYPMFRLKAKGFYGKTVKYDLHLVKFNTQFNANSGCFEINCEFVGFTYAYLSDLLIGYIRAVPYTTIGSELVSDFGKTFYDYQDEAFKLSEIAKNVISSSISVNIDEQRETVETLTNIKTSIDNQIKEISNRDLKRSLYNSVDGYYILIHNNKNDSVNDLNEMNNIKTIFNEQLKNSKQNYVSELEIKCNSGLKINNKIEFLSKIKEKNKGNDVVITLFENMLEKEVGDTSKNLNLTYIDISKTFNEIDKAITTLNAEIKNNEEAKIEEFSNQLSSSDINPTIGEYFKIICKHSDLLWSSIHKIAQDVLNNPNRRKQFADLSLVGPSDDEEKFKILPFPDYKKKEGDVYVDDWIGNAAAPGEIIPEANFVEELVQGLLKAYKELKDLENKLTSFENDELIATSDSGTINYIPIHPSDSPIGGGPNSNPYEGITEYDKIINRLANRLLSFMALQCDDDKLKKVIDKEVFLKLGEVEAFNVLKHIQKINNLNDLIDIKTQDTGIGSKILNKDATDGLKSNFIADLTKVINQKCEKLKTGSDLYTYKPGDDNLIMFGADRPKIGLYAMHYNYNEKSGTYEYNQIGNSKKGDFLKIINSEDITEYSLKNNELTLDTEGSLNPLNKKSFSSKYGVPFIFKYTSNNGDSNSGTLMFYAPKAISSYGETYSYFSPTNAKTNISGTKINNLNVSSKDKKDSKKTQQFNEILKQTSKISFIKGLNDTSSYISDLPILLDGEVTSLFMTSFYQYQPSKTKALLLLHSLPMKFHGISIDSNNLNDINRSTYFTDEINNMFNLRTGLVKSSYAWAALVGGLCDFFDNRNSDSNFRIYFKMKGYWLINGQNYSESLKYTSGDSSTTYLSHTKTLMTNNSNSIYEKNGIGLAIGNEGYNTSEDLLDIPLMIRMLPDSAKQEFKNIWFDFVDNFKNNIEPNTRIFGKTPKMTNIINVDKKEIDLTTFGVDKNIISQYNFFNFRNGYVTRYGSNNNGLINTNGNICKFKYNSDISNEITELINRNIYISVLNPYIFNGFNNIQLNGVTNFFDSKKLVITMASFVDNLKTLIVNTIDSDTQNMNELKESIGLNDSEDIRIKVYKDIKSIYEKWVNGDSSVKDLYSKFKFQNRTYQDISETFKINPLDLIKDLMNNLHQPLISHISKVLTDNNFNFLPTPSYIDIHNTKDMTDLFKPYRWSESVETAESMFVCMYVGEYSSKLDINQNGNYKNDGITIGIDDYSTVPQITNINAADFVNDLDIPIIRVKFGAQDQSIFKNFGLDQTEFTITNESLVVTDSLTNKNGLSQNLYDVYLSRSYTLNLELLGNLMIQPFMYLYLENIPMFYGLYYIIKVSHKISANSVMTSVKAVRMRQTKTKMLDDKALFNSLFSILKDSELDMTAKFGVVNSNYLYDLVSSKVEQTETLNKASNGEDWLLRETHEFLIDISREWYKFNEKNKRFSKYITFTAGSYKGGGKTPKHKSHQKGIDFDLRLLQNGYESYNNGANINSASYSKEAFLAFVEICKKVGSSKKYSSLVDGKNFCEIIALDDRSIKDPIVVTNWGGHSDHIHVRVRTPKYITSNINERVIGPINGVDNGTGLVKKGERIKELQKQFNLPITGEFDQQLFNKFKTEFGLNRSQAAHCLGQMATETNWFTTGTESMNYSASRITKIFGSKIKPNEAKIYENNPKELAKKVYSGINGNRHNTDDAWNYLGRGGIQISGRDMYNEFSKHIGEDVLNNPELVNTKYYFATGPFYFKKKNEILKIANSVNEESILAVSRGVNIGNTKSGTPIELDKRKENTLWFYNKFT